MGSFRTAITVVAATVFVTLAAPAPANAHVGLEDQCKAGEICLFIDVNYGRGIWQEEVDNTNYIWDIASSCQGSTLIHPLNQVCAINNAASSIDNDGNNCGTRHFISDQFKSDNFWLGRGNAMPTLASRWNDNLQSHRWCR